jgi:uncharacterized protein (TIGR00255 family)
MIKSMTGYGKSESDSDLGKFTVEIRSVNHRYGEISIRMPRGFLSMESEIKRLIAAVLKRGKIDVFVQWEENSSASAIPQADMDLATGYAALFKSLSTELGLSEQLPLSLVISQKGVLKDAGKSIDESECLPQLVNTVKVAIDAIDAMRIREGLALSADILERRAQLADWVEQISSRSPLVVAEYHAKLKTRLDQLLDGAAVDEGRLAQEVALMADRCDVTEELVRLNSHFIQFDETLQLAEPVGRKLDFMMQEMNREINTIGSKSNDSGVTSLVIKIKAEMEKMREQIQNIE